MQWHAHTDISPPIAINVRNDSLGVTFSSGDITGWWPSGYERYHEILGASAGGLSKGRWHDFLVHVRFSPDRTGVFEVWHKFAEDPDFPDAPLVSLTDIPTLQWSTSLSMFHPGYAMPYRLNGRDGWTSGCWIQHGLYRGDTSSGGATNTVYHDNWCRGTEDEVRARFR
jgi:hypothetical protein